MWVIELSLLFYLFWSNAVSLLSQNLVSKGLAQMTTTCLGALAKLACGSQGTESPSVSGDTPEAGRGPGWGQL